LLVASMVIALLVVSFLYVIVENIVYPSLPPRIYPTVVQFKNLSFFHIGADHETKKELYSAIHGIEDIPILIHPPELADVTFHFPPEPTKEFRDEATFVEFGGLDIRMLEEDGVVRVIYHDHWEEEGDVKDYTQRDDTVDNYYAFDDDYLRSPYASFDDDTIRDNKRCRRVSWHRFHFPNCNTFHEMDLSCNAPVYLSYGAYRDVFVFKHTYLGHEQRLIWKQIQVGEEYEFSYDNYEFVRMDALVSERLTFSPRIVDIYGHCGLSMLSELLPNGEVQEIVVPTSGYTKKTDQSKELHPENNLTASEKLFLAKEMAEGLAVLHGFRGGVMVHNDVQLCQWLYDEHHRIKLNDFNRAEVMLYDEENGQWCRYRNGPGNGNYRAPEEYVDKPLDEKIDVYSFGNNIYALLTGLWPQFDGMGENQVDFTAKISKGLKPYVDPRYKTRSFAEGKLVEVLERCWEFDQDKRTSIFEVLDYLRSAVEEFVSTTELAI
jgi:serine/threonine protein kinase